MITTAIVFILGALCGAVGTFFIDMKRYAKLREKLGDSPATHTAIVTEHRVGYRFVTSDAE